MSIDQIFENPLQKKHAHIEAVKKVEAQTRHEAIVLFKNAKDRLLDINNWHQLCHNKKAGFELSDKKGLKISEKQIPEVGNTIRISSPLSDSAVDYNWARIEGFETEKNLLTDKEVFGFKIRPICQPEELENGITYTYTSASTVTFLIIRKGRMVTALEIEKTEAELSRYTLPVIAKRFISDLSTRMGFSKPQWHSLITGVLTKPTLNY